MWDSKLSRLWLWRMRSSGMWQRGGIVATEVSEERLGSVFVVETMS
jgi:hypothetical protein